MIHIPGVNAVFSKALAIRNYLATAPHSTEVDPVKKTDRVNQGAVAKWGPLNLFPIDLDNKIALSAELEAGIQTLTEFTYGNRIATYIEEKGPNGQLIRKEVVSDEFELWKEKYNFNEIYYQRAIYNFFRYANVFIEFSFDEDKISHLFTKDAPYCRISTIDPKKGLSHWMYQSSEWGNTMNVTNEEAALGYIKSGDLSRIPLIDARNPIEFIKKREKNILLGYHIKDYSPGSAYYGQSPWYPLLNNEWLDIAAKAPAMIKAYYENLITVARHVEINSEYISSVIQGHTPNSEEAKTILTDLQKSIEANLTGADKAFKTIFSQFGYDQVGKEISQYKITTLENPNKDSSILKDIQHVNSVIASTLRLDSSLIGGRSDGSKEADAGSEKRQASNLLQQRQEMVRQQILYPLTIVKHVNQWDSRIRFGVVTNQLETTDYAPDGKVETL